MRFRRPDGRHAKLTLGSYDASRLEAADEPVLGAPLTLGQARQLANKLQRDRKRGVDVIEDYKAEQSRQRVLRSTQVANSFTACAVQFFREHRTNKWQQRPRRWREDARILGLDFDGDPDESEPVVRPGGLACTWRDKPIAAIDGHDIHAVVDDARRRGHPGLSPRNSKPSDARGRKMHAALSVLFRWALQHRRVASNPCVGVWHPGAPPARERKLTDDEVRQLWLACDRDPHGPLTRLMLLTGCRLREATGMRRCEVVDGVWTIPGERTKNHLAHALPLPPLAMEIIQSIPELRPTGSMSHAKARLDALLPDLPPWRLHDLRRTCASGMQRLGIRTEVIERCLNHVSGSFRGVAGIYQRDPMTDEVAAALARWAAHVQGLVAPKVNVVPLGRAARPKNSSL
jgi:integrase